eukprot:CAMPEP_0119313352 /NCGR_PEP_ID=MMETSP1333-20130426/28761_1 /TAXON_ID=418940 /ORGANISM="Scyphosphaera apsteinii, Strain RCC1455" /LENGTH=200 /DNA_ID=CAMNT_0007318163 /DNA_START=72 /DNA_END=671 /DNA_ORIENTATION=-
MRLNEAISIETERLRLVPYRCEHVPAYNTWMQDLTLLELTCSEPLSLEEEIENQNSWLEDPAKLTFIICSAAYSGANAHRDLTQGMCGDVNAFLSVADDEDSPAFEGKPQAFMAELEVMIAEPSQRRKGLALEALRIFMHYILVNLPVTVFVAKITDKNIASFQLFARLGFAVFKPMPIFQQTELRLSAQDARVALQCAW